MKISEMIRELKGLEESLGDAEVFIDLDNAERNCGHGEYSFESTIKLSRESISLYDEDEDEVEEKVCVILRFGDCE